MARHFCAEIRSRFIGVIVRKDADTRRMRRAVYEHGSDSDSDGCRSETDPTGLHGNADFDVRDGCEADFRNDCDGGKSSGFHAIRQER